MVDERAAARYKPSQDTTQQWEDFVMAADSAKFVYSFGGGSAEGRADMKALLGGKGANLAEMANLGLPVPPGFTISTEVCTAFYENGRAYPDGLDGADRRRARRQSARSPAARSSATPPTRCSSRCAPAPAPRCRA